MISENLLEEFGAKEVLLVTNEIIFSEGQSARFYYQVKQGGVKMYNLNENGKEFVQGLFYEGDSFGEPPLFGDFKYPAGAAAIKESILYKLEKEQLFLLLKEHFEIHLKLTGTLSKRLSYKSMILQEISVHPPEHRILTFIDFLKKKEKGTSPFAVDLTRQQLADLTGLRVETVIRAVKQLELAGEIELINRKVYR